MRRRMLGLGLASILGVSAVAAADSTWVDHYRAARAAHAAGDIRSFRAGLLRVRTVLGDQPGINYNLACAAARLGDRREALARLSLYAASGLTREADRDSDFVSLWQNREFRRIADRIRANGDSIGTAREHHRLADAELLSEDIAYDPVGRSFFVTSIHRGHVVELGDEGREMTWTDPEARPGWGVFAAGVDPKRRLLWTTVGATPTADGYAEADSGRTALLAWDIQTRRPIMRLEWPSDGRERLLGDLTVGADGTVYASDSRAGAVRVVWAGAETLDTLVPDGTFEGPQTPALAPNGGRLYVADYSRGIGIVELGTRTMTWMTFAPGIALQGIDGLYFHDGDLLAVQNGVRPRRIMRFRLDATGTRVVSGEPIESGTRRLGEPTHGVVVGRELYFLANTGWERVGGDQRLKPGAAVAPAIMKVELATKR